MGPKGTWTPFHADVFRSYSWSANICGKKKWIFYPPGCEESLKDRHGNLIYDIMSPDHDDLEKYPHAHKVKSQRLEVIQGQGQVIFVPSGWHHQVFNLEDTISINHNWLNGCNIDICWKHLYDNLINVKHEIEDCKNMEGWTEQCQLILKATAGMDYLQFIDMLKVITSHRLLKYHQLIKLSCSCEVKSTCLKKGVEKIDDHNNSGHNDDKKDIGNTNGVYDDDGGGDVNEDGNFEDDDDDDDNDNNGGRNDNKSDDHNNVDGDDNKKNTGNNVNGDDDDNDDGCCDYDEIRTDDLNNCDKNLDSDFKRCDMTSNETVTDKCSCDVDKKISLASICQNCGKMKFKNVHEHHFSMQDWVDGDYLIFDLQRIEEVLNVIIQDFDYQLIDKVPEQTAEYVLELINKGIDLCLCK
ncbi:JmjC domain-containing protein 4 [Mactra antiquata]